MKTFFILLLLSQQALAKMIGAQPVRMGKWSKIHQDPSLNVKNLIDILKSSNIALDLLKRAKNKASNHGLTLTDVIKPGPGSLTDTTLIRRFSISNPDQITYETRSIIYLNEDLNVEDAIMDLAHELTHYVYRKDFNPYKMNFTLEDFIKSTIEGEGGEVHAFMTECQVLEQLSKNQVKKRSNCIRIMNEKNQLSFDQAVAKFYQVGPYYNKLHKKMMKHDIWGKFNQISSKTPRFISSAYGVPYPLAAYEEYVTVLSKVCENDRKRLTYFMQENQGRSPASQVKQMEQTYFKKCSFLNNI